MQARHAEDPSRVDEQRSFARRLGVEEEALVSCNILSEPLELERLADVDALLVGGAGEYSVVAPQPPVEAMIRFLARVAERGFPTFASCFGFQALVVGLGGDVVHDEEHAEVGTYEVERTEASDGDSLFGPLPTRFMAQMGHKDRANVLPGGVTCLACNENAPFQALKVDGAPIYATQFHPELTSEDNIGRFRRYFGQYAVLFGAEETQRRMDSHRPSPEANALLSRFVALVLGPGDDPLAD
jgi:GMP synthase (glutamine-hydrolysing)